MSLEHALLDRLEKRSLQIAQQKNESYGLRQLVNEKMAINEQLAEQVTTARLERDQMQHQISELRTECDRIREISKSLVPKSALKQAVQEAAELQSKLTRTRLKLEFERDKLKEENKQLAAQIESDENVSKSNREHAQYQIASLTAEVARLRAEVPLESTRDGLKNAVAKLQEVTTDRDRVLNELAAIVAEANKTGRCGGDPVALLKQGQVDRDTAESLDRQLGAALALSNERAQEIRKLIDGHAEDMKAQAELAAQLDSTKAEAEEWLKQCHAARRQRDEVKAEARKETQRLSDLCAELQSKHEILLAAQNTVKADVAMVYQIADKLGRNQAESIPEFMERQALRLAALESEAGPTHSSIDWQVVARNLEQTVAGLNAKVAELEAQGAYATKVASQLGERIAYVQKQSMALETLVMRIKSYRNTEAVQQCALIHQLIDATLEPMGTRLTA